MYKSLIATSALSLGLVLFAGCTSGGFNSPPGTQCMTGWNPFGAGPDGKLTLPAGQKPVFDSANPPTAKTLPVGTYKYVRSDMFFVEKNPADGKPLMIQTTDQLRESDGKYHTTNGCVRNMRLNKPGMVLEGNAVSNMTVAADGTVTVTPRHLMLTFVNQKISYCDPSNTDSTCGPTDSAAVQGLPTDVMNATDSKPIDYLMLQTPGAPNDYEIRAHYLAKHLDGTPYGDYYISSHMTFTAAQ